nr:MAG TPA: hypothetical protein [Caudoviricetes sp.]
MTKHTNLCYNIFVQRKTTSISYISIYRAVTYRPPP